ncbi:hypothetical protein MPSYJ_00470 [Mycolicibacterium psychrotolerans]|uniref:Restriction endonuclease n=1 Tax=Mycolicibacterium psychrotolerans TaxID=216929 RepID=A0A7I7M3U6_9MYCO|nr:hypothetical protein MPSYJ_00470 [Mycolicibacterium psychrotolerans]
MTEGEAADLRQLGIALASQKRWWGEDADSDDTSQRSVVRCHRLNGSDYDVRVSDAVGVIGLEQTQLIIDPKIPLQHLLYLFGESDQFPRSLLERTQLGTDASFFTVVATWFTEACEQLLRRGLVSDYSRITDDIACARGRIHTVATARSVLSGRPRIRCDYDVRSEDTSLNRIVKAAILKLLNAAALSEQLRARCRRIQYRLSDVGALRPGDMRARPDLLTRAYRDVHPLALMILESSNIAMNGGNRALWTFLCRTPEPVEAGVRNCLSQRLGSRWPITKRGLTLAGDFKRVLNPDLVFGSIAAVGDVKYKVTSDGSIARADLNQITTFATGYRVAKAVVVGFGTQEVGEIVRVGPVEVSGFNWNDKDDNPLRAADRLARNIESSLESGAFMGLPYSA